MLDGFNDLVKEVREKGELVWVTEKKDFIVNANKHERTPNQIKSDVLNSDRLKHVIRTICSENDKLTESAVIQEAKKILDEMAHNFDMKTVRFNGYLLIKVFTRIYKHIYYNNDLKSKLNNICKSYPVLYLPNHRSYMDFLLVSIVCYHANIQMPMIATGQDFLGLSFVSELLRKSGAFFIRRSFGSDKLYWAIFHEYVQQHITNQDRPIEFFLEGMRSRTSKFLLPKQGMFATCLECLLKGQVSDVYVVPISVTYERLLEEQLYANELLGIPKPKETISGLMKARSIISQSYGTIIINFSQPISMHAWLYQDKFHLNRLTNVMTPRFIFQITPDESKAIEACSYDILERISSGQVIQPISLICTSLLQNPSDCEMNVDELLNAFKYLQKLFANLSVTTYMPIAYHDTDESNSLEILKLFYDNFKMHSNLFDLDLTDVLGNQRTQVNLDTLELSEFLGLNKTMLFVRIKTIGFKTTVNRTDLFQNASTYLCVCSYRNQLVNFLISYSILLISLIRTSGQAANIMDVYKSFAYLVDLYDREFLFNKSNLSRTFDTLLNYSKALNLIDESLHLVANSLPSQRAQWFLISLIKPYLCNYLAIYKLILANNLSEYVDDKAFLQQLQTLLYDEILLHPDNTDMTLESLSLNLIQNSLSSLGTFGILRKSKLDTNAKTFRYTLDLSRLQVLANNLTGLCESLKYALDSISAFNSSGFHQRASDSSSNMPLSKL